MDCGDSPIRPLRFQRICCIDRLNPPSRAPVRPRGERLFLRFAFVAPAERPVQVVELSFELQLDERPLVRSFKNLVTKIERLDSAFSSLSIPNVIRLFMTTKNNTQRLKLQGPSAQKEH